MEKIRAVIVDDETLAREKLRRLLEAEPDIEILGEAADGEAAVELVLNHSPDLLFLDVQMPELTGFEVLESLGRKRPPCVIFVTAHDQFALRAFEAHAIEYLLKPFDRVRFQNALMRARELTKGQKDASKDYSGQLSNLLRDLQAKSHRRGRLAVRNGQRTVLLKMDEIQWCEAADNYVVLHVGSDRHLLRETMTALEARLDPHLFLRVSRSAMVNVDQIHSVEPLFYGEQLIRLQSGAKVTCSRGYRNRLREFLGE